MFRVVHHLNEDPVLSIDLSYKGLGLKKCFRWLPIDTKMAVPSNRISIKYFIKQ